MSSFTYLSINQSSIDPAQDEKHTNRTHFYSPISHKIVPGMTKSCSSLVHLVGREMPDNVKIQYDFLPDSGITDNDENITIKLGQFSKESNPDEMPGIGITITNNSDKTIEIKRGDILFTISFLIGFPVKLRPTPLNEIQEIMGQNDEPKKRIKKKKK